MENQKSNLKQYCKNLDSLKFKLALKMPKHNFSELMLWNVAQVTTVDLQIISKLSGINSDRFDWYLVQVSGTFEDLFLTINCWEELGVEKYLVIPA